MRIKPRLVYITYEERAQSILLALQNQECATLAYLQFVTKYSIPVIRYVLEKLKKENKIKIMPIRHIHMGHLGIIKGLHNRKTLTCVQSVI